MRWFILCTIYSTSYCSRFNLRVLNGFHLFISMDFREETLQSLIQPMNITLTKAVDQRLVAIVTGGGQGIGKGCTLKLFFSNCIVHVLEKSVEGGQSLQNEVKILLERQGKDPNLCDQNLHVIPVDISDHEAVRKIVDKIGHVDLLINNAGVAVIEGFLDITPEGYQKQLDVNVKGAIFVTQAVAKQMVERKIKGSIVNISSQSAFHALSRHTVYCTTKAALDGATRNMAMELAKYGIRVNSVNPVVVLTPMGKRAWDPEKYPEKARIMKSRIPLGRFLDVEEVVDPIMFLLSTSASMITGTTLVVDGGCLCAGV